MRRNISLPDDLRERMRPHDAVCNWSAIACAAFRAKLRELRLEGVDVPPCEPYPTKHTSNQQERPQ